MSFFSQLCFLWLI